MGVVVLLSLAAELEGGCSGTSSDPGAATNDAGGDDATAAGDAVSSTDGASDAAQAAEPISAPDDAWTWVDFPSSKCASGTPTGIGVNPHAGATTLLLYLEGGGECHSAASCWGASPTANNVAGYDATTFATAPQRKYPVLNRSLSGNPMSAMQMAYVPYCTGDMHAGTKEADFTDDGGVTKPTYFWGATDMDMFLARLVPTFPTVTRVIVLGTSAGGFGSYLDFDRVSRAFGVRVDIVDDSGPAIANKRGETVPINFGIWGVSMPVGCTTCTGYRDVLDFARSQQPKSNYAFLSFAEDPVIGPDFGYDPIADYPSVMSDYTASFASDPHARTFIVTNKEQHVAESDPTLAPQYLPWLTQMVSDDPTWANVIYPHP